MTAIYARQSVEKRDSLSIGDQIERCRTKLSEGECAEVYRDEGYSGKNTERPAFLRLMSDVESGRVDKIIFYKLDRVSRNLLDFSRMLETLEKRGATLVSCTDNIDTTTPSGRAMLNVTMVFAQMEREQIQQRITDNYYSRGRRGFYLGGRAPYGYVKIETRLDGKKTYTFEPHSLQADIVQSLFRDYAYTDVSLGNLSQRLAAEGVATNFGKPWSSVSLGRLLRNPVYVRADADVYVYLKGKGAEMNNAVADYTGENGCYLYAKRKGVTTSKFTDISKSFVTLGIHKGLIDSATWLRCQRKLDTNKQIKNSGSGTHSWLSGLIKCGYCGYAINVVNGQRGGYDYINCGGRKLRVCDKRERVIHLSDIEGAVETQLLRHITGLAEYVSTTEEPEPEYNPKLNSLKIEYTQLDEKIQAYIEQIPNAGAAVMARINSEVEKLEARQEQIIAEFQKAPASVKANYNDIDIVENLADWRTFDLELQKAIAKIFISKATVTDENINITFL
ncbi:MAG: recombinase family protein [Oscillospiraceae bacterium]|jgi:DNA invertase Pin-like site-specific DNA recombinase|nr:recombinase family protein [Oscillospiraceae bacterium]